MKNQAHNQDEIRDILYKVIGERIILNSKFNVKEEGHGNFSLIFKTEDKEISITVFTINQIEEISISPAAISFIDGRKLWI
jgi:hypothetical protein